MNAEFFASVYPNAAIATAEEFTAEVKKEREAYYDAQSRNQIHDQIYHHFVDHTPMELPEGYHAKIVSRSGLASKGIVVSNSPGILDSDYRGRICVLLTNISKEPMEIKNRTRIAQMLIEKHESVIFSKVTQLSETERASGGFGSTGIN